MEKITIDGNTGAATIAYAMSEIATIYPITPSSTMAELCDAWASEGRKNIFGRKLKVVELQSEGGASGTLHGSLVGGALTTTFTASQGLLLMIPNMYKIAGELTPAVMHVSARALAYHALSIFGDHSDVMSVRQTGWAMLASASVQETMDMALVAHLSTLKASVPFVHFFDGFRTSHEINTIENIDIEKVKSIVPFDKINAFKNRALQSNRPHQQGTAQNPDIYFQNREACNTYYNNTPAIVQQTMDEVAKITGRQYHLFDYFGDKNAERVVIIMGSGSEISELTVDYLNREHNAKVGVIKVRLYRPFSATALLNALPKSVKKIAVLDRTKESGSDGEPLYKDVVSALFNSEYKNIIVVGGRYGLGSKEFTPSHLNAVFENLESNKPKNNFTVGINDDVTHTSLKIKRNIYPSDKTVTECKFYGYGGDGTVSANKSSIKIIGNNTNLNGQAYFEYDSKKSGNATISNLRFGKNKISESYLLDNIDFVSCHNQTYVTKFNLLKNVKNNATFLLNTEWSKEELEVMLPNQLKQELASKNIKLYIIDAYSLADELGLGNKINLVMQSAFFKLINIVPYEIAKAEMKVYAKINYGKFGEQVLDKNYKAIDSAEAHIKKIDYPDTWKTLNLDEAMSEKQSSDYFKNFIKPIQRLDGDKLPVSSFNPRGIVPTNTTVFEKRGVATDLPCWVSERCIQCNLCSFVCPHASIRPYLVKKEDMVDSPENLQTLDAIAEKDLNYTIQVSPLDCTGCGVCLSVCPAKDKALVMKPASEVKPTEEKNFNYLENIKTQKSKVFKPNTVKGSQFNKPYFEFSGACAGCGETPYIKVISQLFGNKMVVANATGCSSIYGGSAPTCPFSKDELGNGVAWANSLFEDNAEFGMGINLALNLNREVLLDNLEKLKKLNLNSKLNSKINEFFEVQNSTLEARKCGEEIVEIMLPLKTKDNAEIIDNIDTLKNHFAKNSMWIIGGDGWAYDIGYGGLDHVLASGENVNILVLDTEVYSNTGGQMSKATQMGAVAKFATDGKQTHKKDLGLIATTYKNVYVAKVAMGANMNQFLTAVREAESYNGVSLIIAYAPCINHGINMSKTQLAMKNAVESGYWHLWRYNPLLAIDGKNPFVLDSKEPTLSYNDFILSESRYKTLLASKPEIAKKLFKEAADAAKAKYQEYLKLSQQ